MLFYGKCRLICDMLLINNISTDCLVSNKALSSLLLSDCNKILCLHCISNIDPADFTLLKKILKQLEVVSNLQQTTEPSITSSLSHVFSTILQHSMKSFLFVCFLEMHHIWSHQTDLMRHSSMQTSKQLCMWSHVRHWASTAGLNISWGLKCSSTSCSYAFLKKIKKKKNWCCCVGMGSNVADSKEIHTLIPVLWELLAFESNLLRKCCCLFFFFFFF